MKLQLSKIHALPSVLFISLWMLAGCKKDQITVDQTKQYSQVGHVPANAYDGGWNLTLQPGGVADVIPGGDIVYRGTYKINGAKIKVKTEQNSATYNFEILSPTEIKEADSKVILKLKI